MTQMRCAIYTRKSTEEGLDMAFNSLDAQREACEAYIKSQKAEGWLLLPTAYDDGGFSGGSMERPGLARLMADVKAGKIDIVVVYKVDRLTRALSDFAKIVDVLDGAGASFVSVTQAFNTTTSMGRLTLNVLLSFAQFEREVIAERVRDKIAQSKARGIWMGGTVPLGYAVQDRKLIPVPAEVETVNRIYSLYLELPSVRALKQRLDAEGIVTKLQRNKHGPKGGLPFGRGGLYHLLSNPIVIGKLRHKEKLHEGEHPAIVPLPLWDAVQARLQSLTVSRRRKGDAQPFGMLTGMVRDHHGRPLSPSFTVKDDRRYHYYVSNAAQEFGAGDSAPAVRVQAKLIQTAVKHAVLALLDPASVLDQLEPLELELAATQNAVGIAQEIRSSCTRAGGMSMRGLLHDLGLQIIMSDDSAEASIDGQSLLAKLTARPRSEFGPPDPLTIDVPIVRQRRGRKSRLVLNSTVSSASEPDQKLVALLVKAHRTRREIFDNGTERYNRHPERIARLAFLAPDITAAILEGRQPVSLTSRSLLKLAPLPMDWSEQRAVLGFG